MIELIPQIVEMRHIEGFMIWMRFEDGRKGVVDLSDELWGEVFEPLKDVRYFKQGRLNREINTICWENGADFAPEFLYEGITTPAAPAGFRE